MIDPDCITKYDMTDEELEESIIFWVLVAGKTAHVISRSLENIFLEFQDGPRRPFEMFKRIRNIPSVLKRHGIGSYTVKARGISELVRSGLDLRTCTLDELTAITGIGPKTARCFVIHSRKDAKHAGLDTHVLRGLRERGFKDVPEATPSSRKVYEKWEAVVLDLARSTGMTPAEFDLAEWLKYRRPKKAAMAT